MNRRRFNKLLKDSPKHFQQFENSYRKLTLRKMHQKLVEDMFKRFSEEVRR